MMLFGGQTKDSHKYLLFLPIALYSTVFHSKKKPSAQVVHIRRDSAQNIVTLRMCISM